MADATPVNAHDARLGRGRPALVFGLSVALYAAHHLWMVAGHEGWIALALLFPMSAGWGLGGLVHPPSFWALTNQGGHLPRRDKVLGAAFGLAGFGVGLAVAFALYFPVWFPR